MPLGVLEKSRAPEIVFWRNGSIIVWQRFSFEQKVYAAHAVALYLIRQSFCEVLRRYDCAVRRRIVLLERLVGRYLWRYRRLFLLDACADSNEDSDDFDYDHYDAHASGYTDKTASAYSEEGVVVGDGSFPEGAVVWGFTVGSVKYPIGVGTLRDFKKHIYVP